MAEKKNAAAQAAEETVKPETPVGEKMVKIHLFKDNGRYKDPVFVGINGKSWLIQRGVDVEVPESVAEVLEHSMQQDGVAAENMMKMEAAAKEG